MEKYYHFTSYDNLESIAKSGLIPQIGEKSKSICDDRSAVFLSQGIYNTIEMYTKMMHHYEQHGGNTALGHIKSATKEIKELLETDAEYKKSGYDWIEWPSQRINVLEEYIECIKRMSKYKTFEDYMKDGCYLSVSGVKNLVTKNLDDCYSLNKIGPSKINVVTLRNKESGEILDSREVVLDYFLSTIEPNEFINSMHDAVGIKLVTDLYNDRYEEIYFEYNDRNYILEEVPIIEYQKKLGSR